MLRDTIRLAVLVGGALLAASVQAGSVEKDWARQDQVRGKPVFAGWSDRAKTVRESIVPSINEHLARGRVLIEDARARTPGILGPHAKELDELSATRDKLLASGNQDAAAWRKLYLDVRWAVRRIVFANPAWDFDKLLFVKRLTYTSSHIYTDHYDGSNRFGGNLCILSPIGPEGKVTEIAPALGGGIFGRFDLSFDAKRVVFSHKTANQGYRLYEVGVDGRGLRQLTRTSRTRPRCAPVTGTDTTIWTRATCPMGRSRSRRPAPNAR
jgi:hypothetical protein